MVRALIIFLLVWMSQMLEIQAQRHVTPGQPWTYVPTDSLPPGAIDTAFENSLYRLPWEPYELRYVFRVNCHIEEVLNFRDTTIYIEIPRNPGQTESVSVSSFSALQSTSSPDFSIIRSSSFGSPSNPEFFFPQMDFERTVYFTPFNPSTESDTLYFGALIGMPNRNFILQNPTSSLYDTYAYFVQLADEVWYPSLATSEFPRSAILAQAFPSPCKGVFSIKLPSGPFAAISDLIIRIYDMNGQKVFQDRLHSNELENIRLPQGSQSGVYTITLHNSSGELAVARVQNIE